MTSLMFSRVFKATQRLATPGKRFCAALQHRLHQPTDNRWFWARHAFLFGVCVAGVKTAAADVMVQKNVEHARQLDWRRVRVFSAFGIFFCGFWQYFLYNKVFTKIVKDIGPFLQKPITQRLRDVQGLKGVAVQVGIENFFNNAICYFPVFYMFKIWFETGELSAMAGIRRYQETFWEDCTAIWTLWIPAQAINFLVCPMWARVSFTAMVSFVWTCYVSFVRGSPAEDAIKNLESTLESTAKLLEQTASVAAPQMLTA